MLTGTADNNLTNGGWDVPNQELIDSYEPGDLRLPVSVKIIEGTVNGGDVSYDPITILAIWEIGGYTPEPDKEYFPYIAKFVNGPYSKPFNTGENWPVYRYADALLLLAECLVEQNKSSDAIPYINQVRSRAGLPNLTSVTMTTMF